MPRKRRPGTTYKGLSGCGEVYVTCNEVDGKLQEVFIKLGKAGGCACAIMTCTGVLISTALKRDVPPAEIVMSLDGIGCHTTPNCLSVVARLLKEHISA